MTNNIVAIQGNRPSKLNPKSDTSIFLAIEAQNRKCKIFYYEPENLSIINDRVLAKGYYINFNYSDKKFFRIINKQTLDLSKCKYLLIRQDPPFNLE
jgi:glutathione synthase